MRQAIKVRNVSKTINGRKILHNINFDIYEGEIVGLVGQNGAGKSTLLKVMTGLYNFEEGEIFYFADPVDDAKDIRDGIITKLVFVRDKEMVPILRNQGAFEVGKLGFVKESTGGGDFDYAFSSLPKCYPEANFNPETMKSNYLFLPEGDQTAHNYMNFGNYLWGMTGYVVGFNYAILQVGAHTNSLLSPRRNDYEPQLDSQDDQLSIKKGIFHSSNKNYRQYRRKK